jgi:AraC family transcriptional regulator
MAYVCTLRRLEPRPAMVVRREVPIADVTPAMIDGFRTVGEFLKRSGGTPAGETYARYLRIGSDSLHLEVGFTVRELLPAGGPVQPSELPAGEAIVTLHRGPYERLPEAVAALEAWMRRHGRVAAGPHWETYLNGPPDVTDPELFETEVVVPLKD